MQLTRLAAVGRVERSAHSEQPAVFSFHSTKVFHTFEGGAVVTSDEGLAQDIRRRRNFGFRAFDDVGSLGTNAKMSEVCAAMGISNLESYPDIVDDNRSIFEVYDTWGSRRPGIAAPDRQ